MRIIFSSILLMQVFTCGFSQTSKIILSPWGSIGFGICGLGGNEGIAMYLGGNLSINRIVERSNGKPDKTAAIIAARYIPITVIGDENHSGMRLRGVDILFGVSFGENVQFRLLTGLGVTKDCNPKQVVPPGYMVPIWEYNYFKTVNIPVEGGLYLTSPHVGFGISGFFSLNVNHQFAGVNLRLEFGKLR